MKEILNPLVAHYGDRALKPEGKVKVWISILIAL